jgi:hypothetical protein
MPVRNETCPTISVVSPVECELDHISLDSNLEAPSSTIWSTLSECERREKENSNLSRQNLEEMHNVRPGAKDVRNTGRNPLKVYFRYVLLTNNPPPQRMVYFPMPHVRLMTINFTFTGKDQHCWAFCKNY